MARQGRRMITPLPTVLLTGTVRAVNGCAIVVQAGGACYTVSVAPDQNQAMVGEGVTVSGELIVHPSGALGIRAIQVKSGWPESLRRPCSTVKG